MNFGLTAAVYVLMVTQNAVRSTHPECSIVLHLQEKELECKLRMEAEASQPNSTNKAAGCGTLWDGLSCWPASSEGQTVSVRCPTPLRPKTPAAPVVRSCSAGGWSEPSAPYYEACLFEAAEDEDVSREKSFFSALRLMYSVGYGASLAALLVAVSIFCCCRKLLCTRNYIHLHLFLSFMLRSVAVFVKDFVLFADRSTDHCSVSTLWCKAAVTFFHFCVLSNFSWLLVEALHLQTLLLCSFSLSSRNVFWAYAALGWGAAAGTVGTWALLTARLHDQGCWDDLDSSLWWIIKTPILISIFINFIIFLNISRIIVQKTRAAQVNRRETHLYRTLLRSTLLLVPLFGVHYVVFALIPDQVAVGARLYLELVLGSFQGFFVALLYCFLNGEVQREIQRTLRRWWPQNQTNTANPPTQESVPEVRT